MFVDSSHVFRLIAAMFIFALLSDSSVAAGKIEGFGDLIFGMTPEEVESFINDSDDIKVKNTNDLHNGRPYAIVSGEEYLISFEHADDVLSKIELGRMVEINEAECLGEFERVLALISARYGEPDLPPRFARIADDFMTASVDFTDSFGANISVKSNTFLNCIITVTYSASPPGQRF